MFRFIHVLHCQISVGVCVCVGPQGAQTVFKELPHEYVSPTELKDVVKNGSTYIYNIL